MVLGHSPPGHSSQTFTPGQLPPRTFTPWTMTPRTFTPWTFTPHVGANCPTQLPHTIKHSFGMGVKCPGGECPGGTCP